MHVSSKSYIHCSFLSLLNKWHQYLNQIKVKVHICQPIPSTQLSAHHLELEVFLKNCSEAVSL